MQIDIDMLLEEYNTLPGDEHLLIQEADTFLYNIPYINNLLEEYNMFHSRVMRMAPKYCYSWHTDPHVRRHIPIISNDGAFMVVENELIRMPVGGVYTVDTTRPHTAVNAWKETRVHIVGTISDENGWIPVPEL